MRTRPDRPPGATGYFGMHAGGATRPLPALTPVPLRDIVIGGVQWQMSAEEYHAAGGGARRRPALGGSVVSITCVRFTTGRLTRITYVTHAAADVMAWPDRELTTLFDVTIPAPAA